ncbi:hypothetical protein [Clostridium kluyveri]|uniref:Uncharacterized protein n=1 Tax=Clostridium kluyveri TaxID=1534 RepID=A0A1L5F5E2_CLOKL|nr:hypothetical protein [Clostridium kluyveri]APM38197.1 hypothetical protein BS101_05300 [Clostridium kluyveri]UZQ51791.1 hypothetical protein OP486_06385 [Clostridium kluyveri]
MAYEELIVSAFGQSVSCATMCGMCESLYKKYKFENYRVIDYADRKYNLPKKNEMVIDDEHLFVWLLSKACKLFFQKKTIDYKIKWLVRDALLIFIIYRESGPKLLLKINKILSFEWTKGVLKSELEHFFKYYEHEWSQIYYRNSVEKRDINDMFNKLFFILSNNNVFIDTPIYNWSDRHKCRIHIC